MEHTIDTSKLDKEIPGLSDIKETCILERGKRRFTDYYF